MVAIIHLIPVLSLLLTSYAMPTEPAPAGGAYEYPAPAPAMAAPSHSADPNAFDESKLQGLLWASWTQGASAAMPAPTDHLAAAPSPMAVMHGSGSMPVTDLNSCLQVCLFVLF